MDDQFDDTESLVNNLELRFEAQNLRFTVPFEGYAPVQAHGWISGLRFYYRHRGSSVSLIVGAFSEVLERQQQEMRWKRVQEQRGLLAHKLTTGVKPHPLDYLGVEDEPMVTGQEDDFYPSVTLFKSYYSDGPDITIEDGFIYLVDNLAGVPLTPKDLGY